MSESTRQFFAPKHGERVTCPPEIVIIVQQVIDGRLVGVERRISLDAYVLVQGTADAAIRMGLEELAARIAAGPKGMLP